MLGHSTLLKFIALNLQLAAGLQRTPGAFTELQ